MMHRWNQHCAQAKSSKGGRWHFPNAIRKYGPQAFSHEVLEVCNDLEVANLAEECWIELFDTRNPGKGFNLAKGGQHVPHPIRRNPWDDPVYRARAVEAGLELAKDPIWKAKVTAAISTPEARSRNKAALNTELSRAKRSIISKDRAAALIYTDEMRSEMSESVRRSFTPEVREKIAERNREINRTRILTEEAREKISAAARARICSPETRAKLSAASKRRWETGDFEGVSFVKKEA